MPVIKAFDLAYGRLRSPDLDKEEEFLRYLESERNVIVMWLDQTEALEELFKQSQQRKSTPL